MATAMRKITIPIKNESTGTTTNEEYTFITPEEMDRKADINGYYEEMTVGDAEQLVSSQYVSDSVPYLYRTTGGSADVGNREYMESIVGGTVAWNQIANNSRAPSSRNGLTITGDTDDFIVNGTATSLTSTTGWFELDKSFPEYVRCSNHKVMISYKHVSGTITPPEGSDYATRFVFSTTNPTILGETKIYQIADVSKKTSTWYVLAGATFSDAHLRVQVSDLTTMFGSTIADYIYSLEQANAGAGVAWFKKYFSADYYEYDAGTLKSVEGLTSHDTVGFNQLSKATTGTKDGVTFTVNGDGTIDASGTPSASRAYSLAYVNLIGGNRYQLTGCPTNGGSGKYGLALTDLSGNVLVNDWGSGAFYTPTANETVRVVLRYWYNYSLNKTFSPCLHLVWSGWRNGEYEPYQKHSYPLDSSLVLRGIPKLDAQNNLYFDGDIYNHDGTVERRYGIVDLGTLDWTVYPNNGTMYAPFGTTRYSKYGYKYICAHPKFLYAETSSLDVMWTSTVVDGLWVNPSVVSSAPRIYAHDSAYTDAASFKTAMSGVYLVYELATPTTEEAEPFQDVQICDDFGTEEFKSSSIVPVGHNTEYPANLRDKLQHLPNLADADGYYMIKQTDKQMSLEHFRIPKAPTEDGEYVLHATVSGGTPTYAWESEAVENE